MKAGLKQYAVNNRDVNPKWFDRTLFTYDHRQVTIVELTLIAGGLLAVFAVLTLFGNWITPTGLAAHPGLPGWGDSPLVLLVVVCTAFGVVSSVLACVNIYDRNRTLAMLMFVGAYSGFFAADRSTDYAKKVYIEGASERIVAWEERQQLIHWQKQEKSNRCEFFQGEVIRATGDARKYMLDVYKEMNCSMEALALRSLDATAHGAATAPAQ